MCQDCSVPATHFAWNASGRVPSGLVRVCRACARSRQFYAPLSHAVTIADEFEWSPEELEVLRVGMN